MNERTRIGTVFLYLIPNGRDIDTGARAMMKGKSIVGHSASEILLYQTEDGRSEIQVRLESGTVWLTQAQMAELFQM